VEFSPTNLEGVISSIAKNGTLEYSAVDIERIAAGIAGHYGNLGVRRPNGGRVVDAIGTQEAAI
jgi:hypothetical protein